MTRLEEARQAAREHENKDWSLSIYIAEGPKTVVVTVEKKEHQLIRAFDRMKIDKAVFNLLRAEIDDAVERIQKL